MAQPQFNPKQEVIVHEKISETLIPATKTKMTIEQNGYLKLSSKSEGNSLLVLPVEYSHCFNLINENDGYPLRILRVNLLQIGILFQRELNIQLRYFTGLGHSRCRLEDALEAKNLNF